MVFDTDKIPYKSTGLCLRSKAPKLVYFFNLVNTQM